jgi:hypothetical protein
MILNSLQSTLSSLAHDFGLKLTHMETDCMCLADIMGTFLLIGYLRFLKPTLKAYILLLLLTFPAFFQTSHMINSTCKWLMALSWSFKRSVTV